MNAEFEPAVNTDKIDNSFPYVLVSSLSGTLVSLAAVWALDRHDLWTGDRNLEDSHYLDMQISGVHHDQTPRNCRPALWRLRSSTS